MVNQQTRPTTFTNKNISKRLIDDVWNTGHSSSLAEIVTPNYTITGPQLPPNLPHGPDGVKQLVNVYRRGFPDLQITVDEQLTDGDKVITRWTAHGTHKGEFFGMTPSGKRVSFSGIDIDRMMDNKIAQTWMDADLLGLMQQIGAVPALSMSKN